MNLFHKVEYLLNQLDRLRLLSDLFIDHEVLRFVDEFQDVKIRSSRWQRDGAHGFTVNIFCRDIILSNGCYM